jgi:pimeloyl-ACP methyl ester carboxylesterase
VTIPAAIYSITGKVTSNGKAMAEVTMTVSVNGSTRTPVQTDTSGNYLISNIAQGSSVTVKPSKSPYSLVFTAAPNQGGQCQSNPATCSFINVQANKTQDFTVPPFTTVFLLHGIGQDHTAMHNLWQSLTGQTAPQYTGIDLSRFVVDYGFDFSDCAQNTGCSASNCGISNGGQRLANYVASRAPAGFVLVGYSLGGLIARDMLANATTYNPNLANNSVLGLITLGSPHWGYAYLPIDELALCPKLLHDMAGSWNPSTQVPNPLSPFLSSLQQAWQSSTYGAYWLAAAGRFCDEPVRNFTNNGPPAVTTGCLETLGTPNNDGVVCMDSAVYSANSSVPPAGAPSATWMDPQTKYVHTRTTGQALIYGCPNGLSNPQLFDPPAYEDLYLNYIVAVINGH